jgi:hypothetical protein
VDPIREDRLMGRDALRSDIDMDTFIENGLIENELFMDEDRPDPTRELECGTCEVCIATKDGMFKVAVAAKARHVKTPVAAEAGILKPGVVFEDGPGESCIRAECHIIKISVSLKDGITKNGIPKKLCFRETDF